MSSQCLSEVIEDFKKKFEDGSGYDVIIKAGQDAKELRAHSFVLRARCSYFERALSSDWEEKDDDGNFIFKKSNITYEVFQIILRYLYTGIIDYDQYSKKEILQFLIAADELGLDKVIELIQNYVVNNGEFICEDPVSVLQKIYQYEPFEGLKNYCLEIISDDPTTFFSSEKFPSIEKQIINMVFQRDDLNMEEIDIWDSLVRSLLVHCLSNCKDDSTWSLENLKEVKQILQEYIPFIRFCNISKEDFYLKVYPFKESLPQDLLNNILRYHMVPNSIPMLKLKPPRNRNFNSVLIEYKVFKLFVKWIDKNDNYIQKSIPYRFNLLLRGTRDGFDAAKFHELCDDKGATISFARVNSSNQIIGGYSPLSWYQTDQYAQTNDSFLFRMTDSSDISSAQISRVHSNNSNSICYKSSYGPTFGGGHDLYMQGTTCCSSVSSYPSISIPSNFTIDEYEVFQVVERELPTPVLDSD